MGFMPFEGQRRWLEASQVSRVADLKRNLKKSVGIWSNYSGVPQGLCFGRSEKVVGGRTGLKGGGS